MASLSSMASLASWASLASLASLASMASLTSLARDGWGAFCVGKLNMRNRNTIITSLE